MHGVPVPADHDPLSFGAEEDVSLGDEGHMAPSYGDTGAEVEASAPPAPALHDPLAPATAAHDPPQPSAPTWQHYPSPPIEAAHTASGQHTLPAAAAGHYPSVPTPLDAFNAVSLVSPAGSMDCSSPAAAAVSAAAAAAAMAAAAARGGAVSPLAVGNPELRIAVHNPLKHMGPSGIPGLEEAYISFEVSTNTSLHHFSGSRFTVRRRFRDFVSLSNLLPKLLHGSFLPARPEKNLIEARRMTDTFVEQRRAALERYLNRLAAHPAAARSEALRVFLEADGALRSHPQWRCLKPPVLGPVAATNRLIRTLVGQRNKAPAPSEVVQPAAACRDVYRLLHENIQQMRGSFKHSPLSSEEVAMRDDTVLMEDEAAALHIALHRAEHWTRALSQRSQLLSESAVSLEALASYEASYSYSETQTTAGLTATAQAMRAVSAAAGAAAASSSSTLQPLRDHHALTPNIMAALHGRERQLLTVMTLRQDLEDRRAKLAAVQLTPASQARKVDSLRTMVGQLEVSTTAAETEYHRQLARNREELLSLRASRAAELSGMLNALVLGELQYEQQQAAMWEQLQQHLPQPRCTTAYMAQRSFHIGPIA